MRLMRVRGQTRARPHHRLTVFEGFMWGVFVGSLLAFSVFYVIVASALGEI